MADTYTSNLDLTLMARGDRNWDATLNAILTTLDAQACLGALAVRPAEDGPSTSLNVKVSAGTFRKSDGTAVAVAATPSLALAASSTSSVYLTDAGVLTVSTSGFPAGAAIVPLATVVTGASTVTSIADARRGLTSYGAAAGGTGTVTAVSASVPAGLSVVVNTATTTPAIAITTILSGLIKGTGSGFAPAVAGTDYLAPAGDGSLTVPLHDKGGRVFDVRAYGAVGDGVTNDTAAILAAIAAAGNTFPVYFPPGVYLVDNTLFSSLAGYSSYTWVGSRSARGCNAGVNFPASTIKFRPADTSKWLVKAANTTAGQEGTTVGPFIHRDLAFDIGDANGFQFGLEDINGDGSSDTVVDGAGQAAVFGVHFDGCAISATAANRASDANGVLTRSGKILVHLTKCFESVASDTSFYGCDTQIRTWGCDKPMFARCRFQGAHLPLDFHGSGTFTVQHTPIDCQFEGWTFTPLLNSGVSVAATNLRMEQNDGTPTGSGKLTLTQTAAVTAGSHDLVFSADMTGVLWPGLSVIELSDSGNTLLGYVTAVSGTTVTIEDSSTIVTWSAAAASVTRYHGIGPLHYSVLGSTFTGIDADASTNCPAFVFVAGRSTMAITGAHRAILGHSPTTSMVIGNRLIWPSVGFETEQNLSGHMAFSSCDPFIVADSTHPHVVVDNLHSTHDGRDWAEGVRARLGRHEDDVEAVARCWAFTPRSSGTYTDNSYLTPFLKIAGDANTTQFAWAWHKFDAGTPLVLEDDSLPSDVACVLRLRYRARSVAATGSLTYAFQGNGTGTGTTVGLTDTWTTFTTIITVPAEWIGAKTVATAIRFTGSGYYLAGVVVEEFAPGTDLRVTGDLTVDGSLFGSGANLTFVVHATGDETIAGTKTFTGIPAAPAFRSSNAYQLMQDANIGFRWTLNGDGNVYFQSTVDNFAGAATWYHVNNGAFIFDSPPSGSGANLTNLDPTHIAAGTAGISITGNAASITGSIAESQVTNLTTDLAAKAPLASPTFTGTVKFDSHYGAIHADTDGATITLDMSLSDKHTVTLGGNRTIAFSNMQPGQVGTIELVQPATGGPWAVTWPTVRWAGGTAPTLATTAGKADLVTIYCRASGSYAGALSIPNY